MQTEKQVKDDFLSGFQPGDLFLNTGISIKIS